MYNFVLNFIWLHKKREKKPAIFSEKFCINWNDGGFRVGEGIWLAYYWKIIIRFFCCYSSINYYIKKYNINNYRLIYDYHIDNLLALNNKTVLSPRQWSDLIVDSIIAYN